MNRLCIWRAAQAAMALIFGAIVWLGVTAPAAAGPTLYTLTDLGTITGSGNSYAFSINSSGEIAGYSLAAGTDNLGNSVDHAFLYNGSMTDLGTLPGDADSVGLAINSSGNIAGFSSPNSSENGTHAILIDPTASTITDLGTLDNSGPNISLAYGLNDSNAVVGYSFEAFNVPEAGFLYGTNIAPIGADGDYALAINDSNTIAGSEQYYLIATTLLTSPRTSPIPKMEY
jgi:probable HAF family extracellular repeat protein